MRRRAFITLLGGAAAWPLRARAQQSGGVRRVGVLIGTAQTDPETPQRIGALREALSNTAAASVCRKFDLRAQVGCLEDAYLSLIHNG